MRRSVAQLPEREREVIQLRFGLDGDKEPLPMSQVARRLGIAPSACARSSARRCPSWRMRRELAALSDAA